MLLDQNDRVVYAALLVGFVLIWLFIRHRGALGRVLQSLMTWAMIFTAVLAAVGLWQELQGGFSQRAMVIGTGHVDLPRSFDGHYYALLEVNGTPVRFVVDTGASSIVLSRQDAEAAGLSDENLQFFDTARTANGLVDTAPVTLDSLSLGPFTDRRVRAYVNGGEMRGSLLGMTYLNRYDRIEITEGRMRLER